MLGYMLESLRTDADPWRVRTAGTLVTEGHAMSSRTRDALLAIPELSNQPVNSHRGHRVSADDVAWAHVIVATEAAHVRFMRTHFPAATSKTIVLGQFLERATFRASFPMLVAHASALEPDSRFDVIDPAGGDQAAYDACASQLWAMAQNFAVLLRS